MLTKKQRKVLELGGYTEEQMDNMDKFEDYYLVGSVLKQLEQDKYDRDVAQVGKHRADLLRIPKIEID